MVGQTRKIDGTQWDLSDRGLTKEQAATLKTRFIKLNLRHRIVPNGKDRWAIYRPPCSTVNGNRLKQIHINKHMISHNLRNPNELKPPITVQTSLGSVRANKVRIDGPSEIVYASGVCDSRKKLPCGARVWIETKSPVKLDECPEPVFMRTYPVDSRWKARRGIGRGFI